MEKNIMFTREPVSNVYENLSVLTENAGYHYVRGEEEEAQKYKEALKKEYQDIGEAVLENKEIAMIVQRLLTVGIQEDIEQIFSILDIFVKVNEVDVMNYPEGYYIVDIDGEYEDTCAWNENRAPHIGECVKYTGFDGSDREGVIASIYRIDRETWHRNYGIARPFKNQGEQVH